MIISKESTGNSISLIKIEIMPDDYQEKVNKQIKEYQKKANIPGFRIGKAPIGMISKMYGKAVKVDEINKIVSESLEKYIEENKIKVLGSPMINEEKSPEIADWEKQENFVFYFDIAIQPEINITLENISIDGYKIIADQKMIENIINDTQKRNGHAHSHEIADENDIIYAEAEELDETDNLKENGYKTNVSFSIEKIIDKEIKANVIGLKKEDYIDINFAKALGSAHDATHLLNLKHEEKGNESTYRIKVIEINHIHEAELNEELFEKVYPGQEIKTEEEFRNKIKEEAENYYVKESDQKLLSDIITKLIEETNIEFPENFLKKWLLDINRDKLTLEQIDKDYHSYEKSLKWQLIENKLISEYDIKVSDNEVRNHIKENILGRYFPANEDEEQQKRFDSILDTIMKNDKETKRIYDELYDLRFIEIFKEKIKINYKEVTFDEFVNLLNINQK